MIIFNFHHVDPEPTEPLERTRFFNRQGITITPKGLQTLIQTLRLFRYRIVSLKEVMAAGGPHKMSPRDVAITFDDGFRNNLIHGLPVLEAEQCPATVFLLAGKIGGNNDWDQGEWAEADRDPLMTETEIKTLGESPWITYGSHGLYHRPFHQLTADNLQAEINDSYETLSSLVGEKFLPILAYPWGDYSPTVLKQMAASPYELGFTVWSEPWKDLHNPYAVPRFTAFKRDSNPLRLVGKLFRHNLLLL